MLFPEQQGGSHRWVQPQPGCLGGPCPRRRTCPGGGSVNFSTSVGMETKAQTGFLDNEFPTGAFSQRPSQDVLSGEGDPGSQRETLPADL